jgi:hypothetical protein
MLSVPSHCRSGSLELMGGLMGGTKVPRLVVTGSTSVSSAGRLSPRVWPFELERRVHGSHATLTRSEPTVSNGSSTGTDFGCVLTALSFRRRGILIHRRYQSRGRKGPGVPGTAYHTEAVSQWRGRPLRLRRLHGACDRGRAK